jgi:hypothetical protein
MQSSMKKFLSACCRCSFVINTSKTEVVFQSSRQVITVYQQRLKQVEYFTELDRTISNTANIDDGVINRISKASATFRKLREDVLNIGVY